MGTSIICRPFGGAVRTRTTMHNYQALRFKRPSPSVTLYGALSPRKKGLSGSGRYFSIDDSAQKTGFGGGQWRLILPGEHAHCPLGRIGRKKLFRSRGDCDGLTLYSPSLAFASFNLINWVAEGEEKVFGPLPPSFFLILACLPALAGPRRESAKLFSLTFSPARLQRRKKASCPLLERKRCLLHFPSPRKHSLAFGLVYRT